MDNQVAELQSQVASLQAQLGMTPAAKLLARIAELETELTGRPAEQARLYAIANAWRAVHAELRDEATAVQKRQVEAKRQAARDQGALETFKDQTLRLRNELDELRRQQSGVQWPVIRSKQSFVAPFAQ